MARLAAIAVLLLSLLAVANCRVLEAEPETVVAISHEKGQAGPTFPQETDAAEVIPSSPTATAADATLQLPSHRRPCRHGFLHRRLRWGRPHGLSHRRFVTASLPEAPREVGEELIAVAEPDPDSLPHTDIEEVEEKDTKKPPRGDEDGGEENESVKAWKREMLKRFRGHGLRFHHHEQAMAVEKDDGEHQEQEDKQEGAGDVQLHHVRLFTRHSFHHRHGDEDQKQQDGEEGAGRVPVELSTRHFHHHHGDEEQEERARKQKHYFHHHQDSDSEVDEVEELARKLSVAIKRRSLRRGGIRHHHHSHAEEGGVRKWFKWF